MSANAGAFSWSDQSANAQPIDWGALRRSAEVAVNVVEKHLREVIARTQTDPAAGENATFFAWLAGLGAFCESVTREQIAREADARKASAQHGAGATRSPVRTPFRDPVCDAASLLGVSLDASIDEIRAALRTKLIAERIHPDHGGDEERAKRIIAARDLLVERAKVQS